MENMTRKVEQMIRRNAKRKLWRRAVSIPAAIVVFVTTYALILPAIAMERDTFCGQEEHRHDESCYVDQLICGYEEGQWVTGPTRVWELDCHALDSVHQHTKECYDDQGNLICRYADYLAHEHNADCYDASGALICPLPENKVHTHTAECYVQEQVLSCGQAESAGHTHTAECYTVTETRTLTCGQEEYPGHTHTAECYNTYNNTYLACGQEEYAGHTHTESCYAPVYAEDGTTVVGMELVCGQAESAGHTHTDACYATETISELICGQEEYPGHTHTDACYTVTQEQTLTCGQEEHPGHTHTDACYTTENRLVCDKPEIILHTHYNDNSENDCYDEDGNLICTQLEVNEHVHSEACFAEREVAPAQEHHHTEVCYQHTLICGMEEHIHTLLCYADPNATPVPSVEETAAPAPDQTQPGAEPTPVGEAEPSVSKGPVFMFDPNASEEEAAEPTEDVEPSVSVEPTEDVEPSVSVEPTESAEPSESPEPTATLRPVGDYLGGMMEGPSYEGMPSATPKATATPKPTSTPEPVLVCGLEEHTHTDDCYNMMGELTCELEEHEHTEDCYAIPEPSESPEHTATPEPVLVCTLTEHTHDEDCYDEDGELICELAEHEHTEDCYATPVRPTSTPEPTATPEPTPTATPAPTPVPTVEVTVLVCGQEEHEHNLNECMLDGEYICGLNEHTHTEDCYATVMMELLCGMTEHTHTEECYDEAGELICGLEEHTHTEDCLGEIVDPLDGYGIATMEELPQGDGAMVVDVGDPNSNRLADYVDSVKYQSNTAYYDPLLEEWHARFQMNFTFPGQTIKDGTKEFFYDFPKDVWVPDSLLSTPDKEVIWEDEQHRFNYTFTKDENGYHMTVKFKDEVINTLGDEVTCYIKFDAEGGVMNTDESVDVQFAEKGQVHVDGKEFNREYDLTAQKSGSVSIKDGKLYYSITVLSSNGTRGPITLDDTADFGGLEGVTGPVNVKVEERELAGWETTLVKELKENAPDGFTITNDDDGDGKFTLTLPQLVPQNGQPHRYVVTYEYDLPADIEKDLYTINNNVIAKSGADGNTGHADVVLKKEVLEKTGEVVKGDDGNDKSLKWHVDVNKSQTDIAGAELTDEWLQNATSFKIDPADNVKVYGTNGNEMPLNGGTVDLTGGQKIGWLEFLDHEGEGNRTNYKIDYQTAVPEGWETQTDGVNNTVTLTGPKKDEKYEDTENLKPGATSAPTPVPAPPQAKKEAVRSEQATGGRNVVWQVTQPVPADGFPKGTKFTDSLGYDSNSHYITDELLREFAKAHDDPTHLLHFCSQIHYTCENWSNDPTTHPRPDNIGEGWINLDDGSTGGHPLGPNCRISSFWFELDQDVTRQQLGVGADGNLTFTYKTFIHDPDPNSNTTEKSVANTFNDGTATYTVKYDGMDKSHDNGGYQNNSAFVELKDGKLTWRIKAVVANAHDELIITDQLDEKSLTLESVIYTVKHDDGSPGVEISGTVGDNSLTFDRSDVSATYSKADGKTEITVRNTDDLKAGTVIEVAFTFKISQKDYDILSKPGGIDFKNYGNTGTVTFDGIPKSKQDNIQIPGKTMAEVSGDYITKNAAYTGEFGNDGHVFNYTVSFNPDGKVMNNGGLLDLIDELNYRSPLELDVDGNFWGVFTTNYPDGTPANPTNKYGFFCDQFYELDPASVKLYKGELQPDGTLKAVGEPLTGWSWKSRTEYELTTESSKGVTFGKYHAFIDAKVPDGTPLVLVYSYKVIMDNWRYSVQEKDYVTWTEHTLAWDWLESKGAFINDHYPRTEATNNATLFGHYTATETKKEPWQYVATIAGSETDGFAIYKVDGKHPEQALVNAEFSLYQYGVPDPLGTYKTDKEGHITVKVKTVNNDGNITYTMILKGDGDEQSVDITTNTLYYLVETKAPDGYKKPDDPVRSWLWYPDPTNTEWDFNKSEKLHGYTDAIGRDENVYDLSSNAHVNQYITNDATETYTLPETGGVGTLVYTLGGLAMLSLAGALVCDRRRRRTSKGGGAH